MIAPTDLRGPFVGATAMTIACIVAIAASVLVPPFRVDTLVNAAVYAALAFLFGRAARSLARARRSPAPDAADEALGDLARALVFAGGFAALAVFVVVVSAIGVAMLALAQ